MLNIVVNRFLDHLRPLLAVFLNPFLILLLIRLRNLFLDDNMSNVISHQRLNRH